MHTCVWCVRVRVWCHAPRDPATAHVTELGRKPAAGIWRAVSSSQPARTTLTTQYHLCRHVIISPSDCTASTAVCLVTGILVIMLKHCQSLSSDPPPPRPAPCPGSPSPPPLPPRFALCTDTISLSSSSSSSGSRCGSRWDSLKIHCVKMTKLDLLNSSLQSTHLKYCMLLTFIFL